MVRLFESIVQRLFKRAPTKQPGKFRDARGRLIFHIFSACFAIILIRGAMLALFPAEQKSLDNIASSQYQKRLTLAPYRGSIYDRRGEPLAISVRKPSFAVNPAKFSPTEEEVRRVLGPN